MDDDDRFIEVIREIEVGKGRMTAHERECAARYEGITSNTGRLAADLEKVNAHVSAINLNVATLLSRGQAAAWTANWKAWGVAGAVIALLISMLAWTGGQLYDLQTKAKVETAQKR